MLGTSRGFAHDNKVLNYNESLLIFAHVTSSIRFVDAIENPSAKTPDDRAGQFDDTQF